MLALADATALHWRGDMRHLPMVGGLPTTGRTTPYLVIKQDNKGDTFLITLADNMRRLDEQALATQVPTRDIGAWVPDETDGPDDTPSNLVAGAPVNAPRRIAQEKVTVEFRCRLCGAVAA